MYNKVKKMEENERMKRLKAIRFIFWVFIVFGFLAMYGGDFELTIIILSFIICFIPGTTGIILATKEIKEQKKRLGEK